MNVTFSYFSLAPGSGIPNVCVSLANAAAQEPEVRVGLIGLVCERDDVSPEVALRPLVRRGRGAFRLFTSWPLRPLANHMYRRALRELAPDWVVVNYTPLDAYAIRFRRALGYRVAYYYHNVTDPRLYQGEERTRRERERAAMLSTLAKADAVFTNSAFTQRCVREATGREATVAPPAADLDQFRPDPQAKAPFPLLLHVGRVVHHKGVHQLLEAFAMIRGRHPDAVLRIVGKRDGSAYDRQVERRAAEVGQVELAGDVSAVALAQEYQRAWLFTCASLFEGFGMPFLEAQACGLPCVGYDLCSVPEIVRHGETGLLAAPGDVPALAEAIHELLAQEPRRGEMADRAVAAAGEFGWDRSARVLCDALRSV